MSRELNQETLDSLSDDVLYPFFAVEMLFDGNEVLRLWTGVGTLVYEGESWFGTGSLLQIDAIEETAEMAVKGASITLSGVPSTTISLALSEPYQGRVCNIYFGTFSKGALLQEDGNYILKEDGGLIMLEDRKTDLTQIFSGFMDQMNIEETPETATIALLVENKLIDLERQRIARYTSEYQKARYPGDKGLDFIEGLQDKEIVWGRAKAS
jgi:hypothetical protein